MCLVINFSLDCVERVATFEWQTEKCYLLLETRHLFFFFKSSFFCWFSGNGCNTAAGGIGLKTADKLKLNLQWFRCGSDLLKFFFLYYDKTSQRFSHIIIWKFSLEDWASTALCRSVAGGSSSWPVWEYSPIRASGTKRYLWRGETRNVKEQSPSFFLFFFLFSQSLLACIIPCLAVRSCGSVR